MDGEPLVLIERIEGGALLRLNRPAKRNAVNDALATTAITALNELAADDDVRAIVLTGSGGSFCGGQDMAEASGRVPRGENSPGGVNGLAACVAGIGKPVVAAINGHCIGGGAVLALSCDIRLGAQAASFRFPAANYGLVVATALLPAVVGPSRAKDLIFTARTIDAAEALAIGLLDRLVAPDALEALAREYVAQIAHNSATAIAWSKRVIDAAARSEDALALEAEANRALRGGPEHLDRFGRAADRVIGPRV
jgi:enoyl-CoA hydratase/carnithine racemase